MVYLIDYGTFIRIPSDYDAAIEVNPNSRLVLAANFHSKITGLKLVETLRIAMSDSLFVTRADG